MLQFRKVEDTIVGLELCWYTVDGLPKYLNLGYMNIIIVTVVLEEHFHHLSEPW